jgi:hypothetical protein
MSFHHAMHAEIVIAGPAAASYDPRHKTMNGDKQ